MDKEQLRHGEDGETLVDVLRARATMYGSQDGFIFLTYRSGDVPEEARLAYGDLWNRARAIAGDLQARFERGARILILCPPGFDYISAFFGCQLAGMVAVPAYPPRNSRHMGRLHSILEDAGAAAILASNDVLVRLIDWDTAIGRPDRVLPRVIAVDGSDPVSAASWIDPQVTQNDLAFLQYTSGTTGRPKGVMVSHGQLMDNVRRIDLDWALKPESRFALWLPPFHDMGLIFGVVLPLLARAECILMAPTSFLQRPFRWIEAISTYRATHTVAPNFAYQLCVDMVSDEDVAGCDLRSLVSASSGAEPVRYQTLRSFADKFEVCGFHYSRFVAGYGLAEIVVYGSRTADQAGPRVLAISQGKSGLDGSSAQQDPAESETSNEAHRFVVSCGSTVSGHGLLIVDAESRVPGADGKSG